MRCIICGNEEESSKEHIIPEAMGNKKFITNKVCSRCNNKLGANVDNYLTDYILVKMIRKSLNLLGKTEKSIKIFPSFLKDITGQKFLFKDDIPSIVPEVEFEDGILKIKAQTIEEAIEKGKKKLERTGLSEEEIKNILSTYSLQEVEKSKPSFRIPADIHMGRFLLAGIKIAYEFACETLDDSYFDDSIAKLFRAQLYKAITVNKKDVAGCIDFNKLKKYASPIKEQSVELINGIKDKVNLLKPPARHICLLHDSADSKLICEVVLLFSDIISFTVMLSEDSKKYNIKNECKVAVVLEDGSALIV